MKPGSYKSRPLALLVLGVLLAPVVAQARTVSHGLVLPEGSQEVGENRYRSPLSYEDTLKYFNTVYKGAPRKTIVNQPGIRAMHFESMFPGSGYEGFNVYEKEGKEVRIFVLPRPGAAKEKKEKKKPGKRTHGR